VTPDKLAKIRALAMDMRGDPATRMVAMEILRRYEPEEPAWHDVKEDEPPNPPGMKNSEEYEQFIFLSLHNWGKSASGNFVHTFTYKNRAYRVVLFKHKKTPTWGWLRVDIATSAEVWSGRFANVTEAHRDAWAKMTMV
jgi:hypothetical protein